MNETYSELLEKLAKLDVKLRYKSFFQKKNPSWIDENGEVIWKNPPTLICEEREMNLVQFILKRIRPTKTQWDAIPKNNKRLRIRVNVVKQPDVAMRKL